MFIISFLLVLFICHLYYHNKICKVHGQPISTGMGGPGYTIKCETAGNPHKHVPGALSMAHAGRDTGGRQFFIVHESQPHLNCVHTVFGQVTSGLETAKNMRNGDKMVEVKVFDVE